MKKEELRKIIKEEIGAVLDDRRNKPFSTIEDWEKKWMDKLADKVHVHEKKEEISEALASFDSTEIAKRVKLLFVLLGKNQGNKGKLVDDSEFYVIAVDALGNGVSISPSNCELQPGKEFPEITITDMVNSQYILLNEILDIHHLFAVIGGSMGSMQAFQWIVSYPDFIEKAVPYVCSPRRTTYDQLIMQFRKEMIETYQNLGADDKQIQRMIKMSGTIFVRTPEHIIENVSHEEFPEYLEKFDKGLSKTFTTENYLCQLNAMITHNIYSGYNNSIAATAKAIKTEVFMIVSMTDHLVAPQSSLELAKLINAEVLKLDNNCGHLAVGCELAKCSEEIDNFLHHK